MKEEALKLWIEWFKTKGDPMVSDHCDYFSCIFCSGAARWEPNEFKHESNCIYLRARKLYEQYLSEIEQGILIP